MKSYAPLLILAMLLSFASGYYALSIQAEPVASNEDISTINYIKKKFKRTTRYEKVIDLSQVYKKNYQHDLINPLNIFDHSYNSKQSIYSTNENCFQSIQGLFNFSSFDKAFVWEEFRCGKRSSLPKRFLSKPPVMHPSGVSYAFLIFQMSDKSKPSEKSLLKILPYFHLSELNYLKRRYGKLPEIFNYLGDLDEDASSYFIGGADYVLSKNYLFIKNSSMFSFYENMYNVYNREKIESFLHKTPYRIRVNRNERSCFFRDGGLCWSFNLKEILKMTSKGKIIILFVILIFVLSAVWFILSKIKQQRFEDNKRRMALQVLTHEFRTPITSLLLNMENVNKHLEELPQDIQEDFLRMSGDIYRLQRLTEMSRNYLKSENSKQLININKHEIFSVNELIEEILIPFEGKVEIDLLKTDSGFIMDEYWFGITLKNLVENALIHGATPVKVKVRFSGQDKLLVSVSDSGECSFNSLDDLTKPFVKGNKSTGTGLGMNIVKNVVEAMGGQLSFDKTPTTFTISLKGVA